MCSSTLTATAEECRAGRGREDVDLLHAGPGVRRRTARRSSWRRSGVQVGDGDLGQAVVRARCGVVAQAAADLQRVVAQVRRDQIGHPAVVVHGGRQGLQREALQAAVAGDLGTRFAVCRHGANPNQGRSR